MELTISSKYTLTLVQEPQPATVYGSEEVATSKDGKPLAHYHLLLTAPDEKPELIRAKGVAVKVAVGPVRAAIRAVPWQQGDRSGIAYMADSIQPAA